MTLFALGLAVAFLLAAALRQRRIERQRLAMREGAEIWARAVALEESRVQCRNPPRVTLRNVPLFHSRGEPLRFFTGDQTPPLKLVKGGRDG